jgi:hypothetical protein
MDNIIFGDSPYNLKAKDDTLANSHMEKMWICKKCNEEVEGNFDVCWKCGFENDNITDSLKEGINNEVNLDVEKAQNNSKILFSETSGSSKNANNEQNDKQKYLTNLKEKFKQKTTLMGNNKNDFTGSDLNKEIITDIKEIKSKLNLFQGRTEAEKGNAKFPDWDIVPPSQFINPRIKPQ